MDSSKKLFRKRFGGYNKKDVNNYIAEENKRFAAASDDMQREIDERDSYILKIENDLKNLTDQKNALLEEISIIKDKLDSAERDVENRDQRIAELEETAQSANSANNDSIFHSDSEEKDKIIRQLEQSVADLTQARKVSDENKDKRIAELENTVRSLKKKIDAFESDENNGYIIDEKLLEKAKAFDTINKQIDDILDHARAEAERIVKIAKNNAKEYETIRSNDVKRVKQGISSKSTSIIGDIRRSLSQKK